MESQNHVKSLSLPNNYSSENSHHEKHRDSSHEKHRDSSHEKHRDSSHEKHRDSSHVKHHSSKSSGDKHISSKHKDGTLLKPSSHHSGDKIKHSMNSSSPKPIKHKDGSSIKPSNHLHSKHVEHSNNSTSSPSGIPKHKDGSVRPVSSKPKDPSLKPKDPSLKHKDPSLKPKDPNLKPKDPSLKHKEHSSQHSDPNKPRDPSLKHKDPNRKLKEGYVRMKDGTIRPKDPNAKLNSSSSLKPKDPNRHSSSSGSSRPDKPRDKPSSGESKHGQVIKKEKRPDGVKVEGKVRDGSSPSVKREGDGKKHSSSDGVKVKVKTENDGSSKIQEKEKPPPVKKIKKENGSVPVKPTSPVKPVKAEPESDGEDELPLNQRLERSHKSSSVKRPAPDSDDEEDDEPLTARIEKVKKKKTSESDEEFVPEPKKRKREQPDDDDDDFDEKPVKKKKKDGAKKKKDKKGDVKEEKTKGKKKKKEEEEEVWKWWEEEPLPEGVKWRFLEHKGPVFAPLYEPLPKDVKFYYDGKHMVLSPEAEEVAGFYARMLDHEYTTKEVFNKNFFRDWRKTMSREEQETITDLKKCNFSRMHKYFLEQAELRKSRTKEEKQALKKQNEEIMEQYGFCIIDGHKEKIGNFKIEPPGLFRGRGDHPKMGMLKKRIQPEQVIINCSKDSKIPEPPEGHKWRKVEHDNKVTWLCSWTENIQGSNKYVMLNPSSRLKGEKDWMKYETARKLKECAASIREQYRQDWKSKEMRIRQRAVALYFIDKLALRAGNEKEEGETADTVGCCSLRVEHIKLHEELNNQEFVVEFDFLGKDSIRYTNQVPVEKRVFKNLQLFIENKQGDDELFDRLNTGILNKHLQELMPGLTAKVFRTYNASITLQNQLKALTVPEDSIPSKILAYNRANRAVAVLCNHQRAAPKTFDKQMANLQEKVKAKVTAVKEARKDLKSVRNQYKQTRNEKMKQLVERKKKAVERLEDQLAKLEMKATDKEENKEIALGTSKLNYLDPRISVAWCKKWEVPIEKVYNRTQRDKFRWAIDMATEDYEF